MYRLIVAAALISGAAASPAEAGRRVASTWSANRTTDPITGVTRCTVAAFDRVGGTRFTRTGAIYPVVEMNSQLGLLVGVSSGGRIRVPTGDIVWRIDDLPFRTLRAEDNPVAAQAESEQSNASVAAMQSGMAQINRLTAAMTATSTMASGQLAREMVSEMLNGRQLIYRRATTGAAFGLTDPNTTAVGQITREGLVPYPLDASFREGLQACGISAER